MPFEALLISASCSWSSPGADRFIGDPVAAVDHYTDIPLNVRATLKRRIGKQQYTEMVTITRDQVGGGAYKPELTDMHFGDNKLCKTVNRKQWAPKALERGLVYCEEGHCLIIPTVCSNVSRIEKRPSVAGSSGAAAAGGVPGKDSMLPDISSPGGASIYGPGLKVLPQDLYELSSFSVIPVSSEPLVADTSKFPGEGTSHQTYWMWPITFWPVCCGPWNPPIIVPAPPAPILAAIPEPATWALLLVGFGALMATRCLHKA